MATLASSISTGIKSILRPSWRGLVLPLIAFAVVFILWQLAWSNPLVGLILYPFRLFVTFVHESGHGLAAIATGGRFLELHVAENGAGLATTAGGNPLIILPMGYLGAALFGAVLLYAANRVQPVRSVAVVVGLFCIVCALFFTLNGQVVAFVGIPVAVGLWYLAGKSVRWKKPLRIAGGVVIAITLVLVAREVALMVGIIAGFALFVLAYFGSAPTTKFVLNALALVTGLNAVNDIWSLFQINALQGIAANTTPNDALALANYTHTPVFIWIAVWISLALLMMGISAYLSFIQRRKHPDPITTV